MQMCIKPLKKDVRTVKLSISQFSAFFWPRQIKDVLFAHNHSLEYFLMIVALNSTAIISHHYISYSNHISATVSRTQKEEGGGLKQAITTGLIANIFNYCYLWCNYKYIHYTVSAVTFIEVLFISSPFWRMQLKMRLIPNNFLSCCT